MPLVPAAPLKPRVFTPAAAGVKAAVAAAGAVVHRAEAVIAETAVGAVRGMIGLCAVFQGDCHVRAVACLKDVGRAHFLQGSHFIRNVLGRSQVRQVMSCVSRAEVSVRIVGGKTVAVSQRVDVQSAVPGIQHPPVMNVAGAHVRIGRFFVPQLLPIRPC